MQLFFKSDFRSFRFLNITQFLGALNDNIFKFLIGYFIIGLEGVDNASAVLAIAGGVFVLPFLLFSSAAGVLADKFSKTRIIVLMKVIEIIIMLLSLIPICLHSEIGGYFALFLLAIHSTIFNPSKYGVIPELVEEKEVPKANGSLTSLTYAAIIIGTFLASFLTNLTNKNYPLTFTFCIVIAISGFIASLGIAKTPARSSHKQINPLFAYEIYKTLKGSLQTPYLFSAILGSAFFLFVGGFVQLNIIPFAIDSLKMDEVDGGYLFLLTALGIAIGAKWAGKLSKGKGELGLSGLAGFALAFLFVMLKICAHSLVLSMIVLLLLGVAGGLFLIPFDTFIQVKSHDSKRGQLIAASSFLSFSGVLLASLLLYVFSWVHFKPSTGFVFMGIFSAIFSVIIATRLVEYVFPYFVKNILFFFHPVQISSEIPKKPLFLWEGKTSRVLWLFPAMPNLRVIIIKDKKRSFWKIFDRFFCVTPNALEDKLARLQKEDVPVCVVGKKEQLPSLPFLNIRCAKVRFKRKFIIKQYNQKGSVISW